MTEQMHPMVPPNILLNNWESDWFAEREHADVLLIQAYQAGADAELEACCKLLELSDDNARDFLQSARRPKPSSLKKQALKELDKVDILWDSTEFSQETLNSLFKISCDTIRKALEALPDD